METHRIDGHLEDESEVEDSTALIEAALAEIPEVDQVTIDRIWEGIQRRIAEEEQEIT